MNSYKTIEVEIKKKVATVWLNRPEVHNAFNKQMIKEITECFRKLEKIKVIGVIIIRGKGKSFCSGADLQWMIESEKEDYGENYKDSMEMANCFKIIHQCSRPTIALVHGTVFGGANGILCACDIAIAADNTRFSFPELRIGLVPATIMPYILTRVNQHKAKLLMYTGRVVNATTALETGLIDHIFDEAEMEKNLQMLVTDLLKASSNAILECKSLINTFSDETIGKEIISSVESITKIKMSEHGREGVSAFLEHRSPKWINDLG
jgi:methylglutaconyl-CoA hydratase